MLPSSWIFVASTRTNLRCGRAPNETSSRSSCRQERSPLRSSFFFKELGPSSIYVLRRCQSGMTRGVFLDEGEDPAGRTAAQCMAQEPQIIIASYTDAEALEDGVLVALDHLQVN